MSRPSTSPSLRLDRLARRAAARRRRRALRATFALAGAFVGTTAAFATTAVAGFKLATEDHAALALIASVVGGTGAYVGACTLADVAYERVVRVLVDDGPSGLHRAPPRA